MDREKLIEDAANAVRDAWSVRTMRPVDERPGLAETAVAAALAVFEGAGSFLPVASDVQETTHTDDERAIFEALADRLGEHSQARNYEIADSGEYETKLRGPIDVEVLAEWLMPTVRGFRTVQGDANLPKTSVEAAPPCSCPCHTMPGYKHVAACCNESIAQGVPTPDSGEHLRGRWSNGDPVHIITDGSNRHVAPNLNGATWIPGVVEPYDRYAVHDRAKREGGYCRGCDETFPAPQGEPVRVIYVDPELIEDAQDALSAAGFASAVYSERLQGERSDDYEAGYAEGFHHGRSTPRESQDDQDEPSNCESDERVQAWEQIAKHSIFRRCYDDERPLIVSMLARLDILKDLEETVNELAPAPRIEPSQAQVIAALEAYGYTKYDLIHPPGHRMYAALRAAAETV